MAKQKNHHKDSRDRTTGAASGLHDSPVDSRNASVDETTGKPETLIKPVREKIGEGADNLRQRGEWYRRRTGGA
ncbi:MAG: hypothetical protein ABR577_04430 [Pyrinomonadaceae bacterium]